MDNNENSSNIELNLTRNLQQMLTESLRNYFTVRPRNSRSTNNTQRSNAQRNSTSSPSSTVTRTNVINYAQIITMLRELIRSNDNVIERYNSAIHAHFQNNRDIIDIIRILTNQLPVRNHSPHLFVNPSLRNYFSPNLPNQQPLFPNNLHSYMFYPSTERRQNGQMFQDVIVRPTTEQIDRASESFEYNESLMLLNTQCPITMNEFQPGDRIRRIYHCRHSFHEDSFMLWFRNHVRCPICRFDIRDHVHNTPNFTDSSASVPGEGVNNDNANDDDDDDDDEANNASTPEYLRDNSGGELPMPALTTHNNLGNSIELLLRAALSADNSQNYTFETINNHTMLPILSFEFPFEYTEYDSSNNVLP